MRRTILTGDRPTGPLHLGHYAGSLATRVELQQSHATYILIADLDRRLGRRRARAERHDQTGRYEEQESR